MGSGMSWKKRATVAAVVLLMALGVSACNVGARGADVFVSFDTSPYTGEINIRMPEETGEVVRTGNGARVDISNKDEGYFFAACENDRALKLQVVTPLGSTYNYDLSNTGESEVFPFNEGNGEYAVKVLEQVEGTSYAVVFGTSVDVEMEDTNLAFLYPSQRINYGPDAQCVYLSYQLTQSIETDEERIRILYLYVSTKIVYDQEFADAVLRGEIDSGYIPNPDRTLQTGKGICYDYSALLCAMLRAQGYPTRLIMGYVSPEGIYHAWNAVWDGTKWILYDATLYSTDHTESDYTQDKQY